MRKRGITKCGVASLFLIVVVYSLILSWISGHALERLQTSRDKMPWFTFLNVGTQMITARKWTFVIMEIAGKIKGKNILGKVVCDNLVSNTLWCLLNG